MMIANILTHCLFTVAVLALQNWGCNASKSLWSSRLPIPIKFPHQFMKLSNVKISSRIISYSASKFLRFLCCMVRPMFGIKRINVLYS